MEWKKEQVATAWDGCWFCSRCYGMNMWDTPANIFEGHRYCDKCRREIEDGESSASIEYNSYGKK